MESVIEAHATVTVGLLLCSQMRDYLEAANKVHGCHFVWHEGSGWFERDFTIRGPVREMMQLKADLDAFFKRLEEAKQ